MLGGKRARSIIDIVKITLLALILVIPIRLFIAQPFVVTGSSMQPAFNAGDYLVIDKLTYDHAPPQRGDVVVFRYPLDPSVFFIKRIVGMPGETVNADTGAVVGVGDSTKKDSALVKTATSTTIALASDEYYVLGDNAAASSDSRQWEPLQRKFIIGRVVFRAWPL